MEMFPVKQTRRLPKEKEICWRIWKRRTQRKDETGTWKLKMKKEKDSATNLWTDQGNFSKMQYFFVIWKALSLTVKKTLRKIHYVISKSTKEIQDTVRNIYVEEIMREQELKIQSN